MAISRYTGLRPKSVRRRKGEWIPTDWVPGPNDDYPVSSCCRAPIQLALRQTSDGGPGAQTFFCSVCDRQLVSPTDFQRRLVGPRVGK